MQGSRAVGNCTGVFGTDVIRKLLLKGSDFRALSQPARQKRTLYCFQFESAYPRLCYWNLLPNLSHDGWKPYMRSVRATRKPGGANPRIAVSLRENQSTARRGEYPPSVAGQS